MTHLILDAYNVIYAIPELERKLEVNLEAARRALIDLCGLIAQRGDIGQIDIVFDGAGDYEDYDRQGKKIQIIYSSKSDKADDCILKMLEDSGSGREFTIVSRDNYVFNHSKAYCARVISPAEFYAAYVKKGNTSTKNSALSPELQKKITDDYKKQLGL